MSLTYAGRYGPEAMFDGNVKLLKNTQFQVSTDQAGVSLTQLWTDKTKSVPTANPTTSDALANLTFFAVPGDYWVAAIVSGVVQSPIQVTVFPDPADIVAEALDALVVHKATASADIGTAGLTEANVAGLVADLAARAQTPTGTPVTVYVDPTRADDTGDGKSVGTAKKTFAAAAAILGTGGGEIVGVNIGSPVNVDRAHFAGPVNVRGLVPEGFWLRRSVVPTGRIVTDAVTTASSTTLTSATASFVAGDANKLIAVQGAGFGGSTLYTTVASVTNGTTVVLGEAASVSTSGMEATIGVGTWDRSVTDGAMSTGTSVLTSATAAFTSADLYKPIYVQGAGRGGGGLYTMITAVNSTTSVNVLAIAAASVTGKSVIVNPNFGDLLTFHAGGGAKNLLLWDSNNSAAIGSPIKIFLDDRGATPNSSAFHGESCRVSENDAVGDWAHLIDFDGSHNQVAGGPGERRLFLANVDTFGANVAGRTWMINGVVHMTVVGGVAVPSPTSTRQGVYILDTVFTAISVRSTANIQFEAFEGVFDLNVVSAVEVTYFGGKVGSGTGGVASVTVGANADKVMVIAMAASSSGAPVVSGTNSMVALLDASGTFTITASSGFMWKLPATTIGGLLSMADGQNIATGTTTGSSFPASSAQKWAAWGGTPIAQPAGSTDILAALISAGLRASGANPPLNIGSGVLTAGTTSVGALTAGASTLGATAAKTLAHTVNAQSVGAANLTLDASLGDVQAVTLTANQGANTTTITNPTTGQLLTIEFIQDGSGSHTYAWPTNVRFAANTAPSASTGANRMDSVTFRYNGTVWVEEQRAINVPVT